MAKIDSNIDSLLVSIQDAFRDCSEQKKRVVSEYRARKRQFTAEGFDEMKVLSDANNANYKTINELISKKIELIKVQAKLVQMAGISPKVVNNAKTPTRNDLTENGKSVLDESHMLVGDTLSKEELKSLRDIANKTGNISDAQYEVNT